MPSIFNIPAHSVAAVIVFQRVSEEQLSASPILFPASLRVHEVTTRRNHFTLHEFVGYGSFGMLLSEDFAILPRIL